MYSIEENNNEKQLNITLSYPYSTEFDYYSGIEIIDFDAECKKDIESGDGFLIGSPKATNKKNIKDPDGIYSSRFGQKMGDANPFSDRYSCECGYLKGRINNNIECPVCHKKCRFVDDNMNIFGWIVLKDDYHIIHPKFYATLDYIFGSSPYNNERKKIKSTKLDNILKYNPEIDQDGFVRECAFKPDKEPYYGIGIIEFYNRFDEILNYYMKLNPKKIKYYEEIMNHRNIVFCHSIPVFTTHLRPADIRDGYMRFEPSNAIYNMIAKHAHSVNKDSRKMDKDITVKNSELYQVQKKYMELVDLIIELMSGKKGTFRSLLAGRHNFSSRAVIRQDPSLRIDQILLPYAELVKVLQQRIINILIRTYNITPSEAYDIWSRALITKDDRVCEILDAIIHAEPEGLPCIINRNPTIATPM